MANIPYDLRFVTAFTPQLANSGAACDAISMKNVNMLWIVIDLNGAGGDTDSTFVVNECTDVAGTGLQAIVETLPSWTNTDTASSDVLTKAASDAATWTLDTLAAKSQRLVIKVNPSVVGAASGLTNADCVRLVITGGNVANYLSATYVCEMRYQETSPPSTITD